MSFQAKPSCRSKQILEPKQPLPEVSQPSDTSSTAGQTTSDNLECPPGSEPGKYVLNLLDALFTDEEMVISLSKARGLEVQEDLSQDEVKKILCK